MERQLKPTSWSGLLLLLLFISGCQLSIRGSGSNSGGDPTSPTGTFPALNLYGALHFSPQVTANDSQRAIDVALPYPGRVYSFGLDEDGVASTSFACSNLPSYAKIVSNRLYFDLGPRGSTGTQSLNCSTAAGGALTINLNYSAYKIAAATGGFNEGPVGEYDVLDHSVSRNGRFVAMDLYHMSGGANLATVYDRTLKKFMFASSTAAGMPDTSSPTLVQASDDGRYAVFVSSSANLVAGSSGQQIFRKNLVTGAVELVSSTDGTAANRGTSNSTAPRISSDGRYVVFSSASANFGANGAQSQIFRKDMQSGTLALVSSPDGSTLGNNSASVLDMTSDGRYVLLSTAATNLISPATSGTQIFRVDLGTVRSVALVSSTDGTAANQGGASSSSGQMSADGRYVAFQTASVNLGFAITGGFTQTFRKDLQTQAIVLVSSTDGTVGNQATSGVTGGLLGISDDGNHVLFRANGATGWFPGVSLVQAYLRNISGNTIRLVSSTDGTVANRASASVNSALFLSPDGGTAFYNSYASNLIAGTNSSYAKIFGVNTTSYAHTLLSNSEIGISAQNNDSIWYPRISKDGTAASFDCYSSNVVPGTDGNSHLCYKSFVTGEMKLIDSVDGTGATQGNNTASFSNLSADGRYVVFTSSANNLVAGTSSRQIFRKDTQTGAIALVSSTDGTAANQGNASSNEPSISDDGRYVVFDSMATNLVAPATTGTQVFLKDMQTGAISLISSTDGTTANQGTAASQNAMISGDGTAVVFASSSTNFVAGSTGQQIFKKIVGGAITLVSSTDGTAANRASTSCAGGPRISTDGRYIAMLCTANNFVAGASTQQAYRKDTTAGTILLASSSDGTGANQGNGSVTSSVISPDGRYMVFKSNSTNLFAGATATNQIYWKDLQTQEIRLVSSSDGTVAKQADASCDQPWIADGGRYVVFMTTSQNLVPAIRGSQVYLRDMQ